MNIIKKLSKEYTKNKLPEINSGDNVRVHQKINEKGKTRIQIFEGIVIQRHGGKGISGTFTVRKISVDGIGVEKNFFLHSPLISKIQILKKSKTRRAQLYYIRHKQLKSLKIKERKEFKGIKEWQEDKKKEGVTPEDAVQQEKVEKDEAVKEKQEEKSDKEKPHKKEETSKGKSIELRNQK